MTCFRSFLFDNCFIVAIFIFMNMMQLPLPVTDMITKHETAGMMYSLVGNFKIGKVQPTFINSWGLWTWTGQIDKNGYYLYKQFKKVLVLTFCKG